MKVLFIDNFDLFTHSIVDEFEKKDCEIMIYRNNVDMKVIEGAIKKFKPKLIVINPGNGNAAGTGNSIEIIRDYAGKIPIFGIGLGNECIIEAMGGNVDRSPVIKHGKVCKVSHDGKGIFKKMDNPFVAGRYNSLAAINVPYTLEVSARDEDGIVMGVRHKECFMKGIQFHPESILTPSGSLLIDSLLKEIGKK